MHTVELRELNRSAHLHNQHSTPYQQAKRAWSNMVGRPSTKSFGSRGPQGAKSADRGRRQAWPRLRSTRVRRKQGCNMPCARRPAKAIDGFIRPGSDDWAQAERLLVNFESPARFVESFCRRMRRRVNDHPLRERPEPHRRSSEVHFGFPIRLVRTTEQTRIRLWILMDHHRADPGHYR